MRKQKYKAVVKHFSSQSQIRCSPFLQGTKFHRRKSVEIPAFPHRQSMPTVDFRWETTHRKEVRISISGWRLRSKRVAHRFPTSSALVKKGI